MYQTMQQWSSDNALHMHMHLVRPPDVPARALELTARHSIHHWAVGRSYYDRIPKPELLESRTVTLGISDKVSTRICSNVGEALVKELQRDIFITARLHFSANLAHHCHFSSANDKILHWRTLDPTNKYGNKDLFCMQARMHRIHQVPTVVMVSPEV